MSKINEPDNGMLWYLLGRTVVAIMEDDVRDIGNFTDGTNRAQLFNGSKKKKIHPSKQRKRPGKNIPNVHDSFHSTFNF